MTLPKILGGPAPDVINKKLLENCSVFGFGGLLVVSEDG
jgi:hypothetical protein